MDTKMSRLDAPPVAPKIIREESDLTQAETAEHCEQVAFVKKRGRPRLIRQRQFKNSLLAGIGYMELANAGDFAANVWNEIPVPKFAVVLMALGGTTALLMSLVAARDFWLSWQNVRLLREEREHLLKLKRQHARTKNPELVRLLNSRLGVGFREIGTETIDRMIMDALMGSGSIMVGVGTIMAIWGADRTIFEASNLLSGYVGNSMAALFGLANAYWSMYLWLRFHRHDAVTATEPSVAAFRSRLHVRFRRFKWHATVNGINGLVAGAASMITATNWWGYVILIPCIVSLILSNYFWRLKLGYDRPLMWSIQTTRLNPLLDDLQYVTLIHQTLVQQQVLPVTLVNNGRLDSILQFVVQNDMFETFCEWLLRDRKIYKILFHSTHDELVITPQSLLKIADPVHSQLLLEKSKRFLPEVGTTIFAYRERYLLELVGCAVWQEAQPTVDKA